MEAAARPRVKICCIGSVEEARLAVTAGASALGLVSEMPSGPGVIPEDAIARIARTVPPGVTSVLLTCRQDVGSIIAQQRRTGVGAIQICDRLLDGTYSDLRQALPGVGLIQVIHVSGPASVDEARQIAPHVHALLLDSGDPALPVKELGGTGRVHDWTHSRRIREEAAAPVYLAGGLTPENAAEAVRAVGPFGLDLCGGVRTGGALDPEKLGRFFAALDAGQDGEHDGTRTRN
jgi:phosphoribosylanthranilate isomerase